jgi:hypothetical protein
MCFVAFRVVVVKAAEQRRGKMVVAGRTGVLFLLLFP